MSWEIIIDDRQQHNASVKTTGMSELRAEGE